MNKQLIITLILSLGVTQGLYPMHRLSAIWSQLWGNTEQVGQPCLDVTIDGYAVNTEPQQKNLLPVTSKNFTVDNFRKYRQYKKQFIQYAKDNFLHLFRYMSEAEKIIALIQQFPDQAPWFVNEAFALAFAFEFNTGPTHLARFMVAIMCCNEAVIETVAQGYLHNKINMRRYVLDDLLREKEYQTKEPHLYEISLLRKYSPTDVVPEVFAKFETVLKNIVFHKPLGIEKDLIELVYEKVLTDTEKAQLKTIFLENLKLSKDFVRNPATSKQMLMLMLPNHLPWFVYGDLFNKNFDSVDATQTKQHLFHNLQRGIAAQRVRGMNERAYQFFLKIYAQEKLEHEHGNYVFYHGRQWFWNFISDMYKQLWNLTHEQQVSHNFQFLRFGNPGPKRADNRDILFMNGALFGNMTNHGSCSAYYWLNNHDQSSTRREMVPAIQSFFVKFGLKELYGKHMAKYDKYIARLDALHKKASRDRGEFLLISIPANKLDQVISTRSGGSIRKIGIKDTVCNKKESTTCPKIIIDTMKSNPQAIERLDNLEWGLMLGTFGKDNSYTPTAYANDPYNGPTIYSFHDADEKVMAAYEKLRDEFFAQIKKDMLAENALKQKSASQIKSKL